MRPPLRLRPANAEDIPMIFNSWLRSYKDSPYAFKIPGPIYFSEHHKLIERLLKRAIVYVACSEDDPAHIYGWTCFERVAGIYCHHYTYVKQPFRKMGIASLLFDFGREMDYSGSAIYTHHTKIMEKLSEKYSLVFHPYICYNPEYDKGSQE